MPTPTQIVNAEMISAMVLAVKPQSNRTVIGAAEDLWDLRLLDSFAVVNLVFKLEEAFDIVFDFPDMNAKNFQSIHSILQLLEQKYGLSISSGK